MKDRYELRFAGSGGQGVILLSVVIAEAAVREGLCAAQTQSYGPEARGGVCKAETIVSEKPIQYTRVSVPDILLIFNRDSFVRYGSDLAPDGIIIADSSLEIPEGIDPARVLSLPFIETARAVTDRVITANIVAAGALGRYLSLFSESSLEEAVREHSPEGTEGANLRALRAGLRLKI